MKGTVSVLAGYVAVVEQAKETAVHAWK